MPRPRKQLALLAVLAALLSVAMLSGTATAATTATPVKTGSVIKQTLLSDAAPSAHPNLKDVSGCNGGICFAIYYDTRLVYAYAWVRVSGASFDGHYQLISPRNNAWNSGPNKIQVHAPEYRFSDKAKIVGKWCLIGWRYKGGHNYSKVGVPCLTVGSGG
jgi:hypothetical protein